MRVHFTIGATLALTPLLILPAYFFHYDVTPKVAVALMGTAIALLLFLFDPGFAGAHRWWAHPLGRWYCLLAGAQLAWLLLSTFFSSHPALSWNGGNWRRFGFVSQFAVIAMGFLIVTSCSESGLHIFLRATAASGTAAALYGILQYFGVDPFLPSASYHVGEGVAAIVRPPSTLGHADYFAGYLLYVAFGGAALLATESAPLWKALGAAAAVAGPVAIVLSGTRGALLGLAAGVVSLWIWNSPPLRKRHAVLALGLCAAGLAFYFSPAGLKLRARGQWALEDLRGGARLWLWRDSLRMADQRLLLGFGPETFGLEFPRYQSADLSRAYPDFYHESPHNIFIDALVSEGIPGLAMLAGFVTLAWFATRRAVVQGQRAAPYLAAALVAGLTAGLFVCFILPVALYFYATVAMLAGLAIPPSRPLKKAVGDRLPHGRGSVNNCKPALAILSRAREQADFCLFQRPARASVTGSRPSLRLRVPVFAFGLTAIAMFLYFAVRLTASDFAMDQAKRDLNAGRIADSLKAYRWSQRWHMAGSSDDLFFSRALAAASRTASDPGLAPMASQQAFSVARRAAETSEERQNAWYNLAAFYATQNDATSVETCLRRSIAASPNWFQPHWALAQMLLLAGRRTEALAEAARAADLDGGKDPEIAKFLQGVHHQPASPAAE